MVGGKNAKLVGELPTTILKNYLGYKVPQVLKLYECEENETKYYVLESEQRTFASITRYYVKVTPEIASALVNLLAKQQ